MEQGESEPLTETDITLNSRWQILLPAAVSLVQQPAETCCLPERCSAEKTSWLEEEGEKNVQRYFLPATKKSAAEKSLSVNMKCQSIYQFEKRTLQSCGIKIFLGKNLSELVSYEVIKS
ncbi:MAG: hypothetical protein IKR91_04080 [Alloprevotella sp.]|nr:hypothetical protein [Alloprevotella sp.]